jgi:hypothetical protein
MNSKPIQENKLLNNKKNINMKNNIFQFILIQFFLF